MKLRNRRLERQPKLMIIPMIDIIFFLLVFFMMSTLYMTEQATFPVNLPQAAAARPDQQHYVGLTVTAQGTVYIGQEEIALHAVAGRIQTELRDQPDAGVVLRADATAHYGVVVTVLDELKRTGIRRIVIAAEPFGAGG